MENPWGTHTGLVGSQVRLNSGSPIMEVVGVQVTVLCKWLDHGEVMYCEYPSQSVCHHTIPVRREIKDMSCAEVLDLVHDGIHAVCKRSEFSRV